MAIWQDSWHSIGPFPTKSYNEAVVPGGSVLGATDGEGGQVAKNEYHSADIGATVYAKLGLPLDLVVDAPDGRPVRLLEGNPIREWM